MAPGDRAESQCVRRRDFPMKPGDILDILAAVADGRSHGPGSMSGRGTDAAGAVTMESTATTRSADAKLVVLSDAED